ncbi:HNH endonuclease signature motif containing protein [Polyangium sp. 15x6]|uniref:HNH endonuclease n=1 Tax=Polyangium sp. 15x6 TaxID=3042687 RepID=UPI00249BE09F|nr:HNH endonuclease signature motif containing protein [Polyangium sp. 15x6]MDI3283223.1 HNH endonuclease signature motif containing protein [Polyangium sp. 15x6]
MISRRYGDIEEIASKTDGNCHLCHDPVDVTFYGPTGAFGEETVTVDHLVPQSFGGDDDPDNLMIAHGRCNSIRGTRDAELVRFSLAGTTRAPMSGSDKTAVAIVGGVGFGLLAGAVLAKEQPDGTRQFNKEAAAVVGLLALLFRAAA